MNYLVHCPCGHSLEDHGEAGCAGARGIGCACRADRTQALDQAIDRVRTEASIIWRRPEETEAESGAA